MKRLFYCDLDALPQGLKGFKGREEMLPFQKLVDKFEVAYDPVANDGAFFTFQTNRNALTQPEAWSDVVGESEKDILELAFCVNENQLLLSY